MNTIIGGSFKIYELVVLIIGIALFYWIRRRKFYRRSFAGVEGFSSFEASVFIRFVEFIGKWIAYLLIFFGLTSMLMTTMKETKNKEIKQELTK